MKFGAVFSLWCAVGALAQDVVETKEGNSQKVDRRDEVKQAFVHAWKGYKDYAFGSDELRPLTNSKADNVFQGWGATLIDSLSTLWLMDLTEEFELAVQKVSTIDFCKGNRNSDVLFFETTIRYLGGLISGYDLSGNKILLNKAIQLADCLLPAFDSPSGLPYSRVNFDTKKPNTDKSEAILSEVGTNQLEFVRLSMITKNPIYIEKSMRAFDILHRRIGNNKDNSGLYPLFVNVDNAEFTTKQVSFGALGDSYYEYLIKLYVLLGETNEYRERYLKMFEESMLGLDKLLYRGYNDQLYIAELSDKGEISPRMNHLTLFVPGMLLLGYNNTQNHHYKSLSLELMESFHNIYTSTRTGFGPEYLGFSKESQSTIEGANYRLRPEYIESLFYAFRETGDKEYQDRAWKIYLALVKHCKTKSGFAELKNVNPTNSDNKPEENQENAMESYFMAETMKYLYLIFSPEETLNLKEWVLNTEAHPLRIAKEKIASPDNLFEKYKDSHSSSYVSSLALSPIVFSIGIATLLI